MQILSRLFGTNRNDNTCRFAYNAIVAEGRQPAWYLDGGATDSVDGRFDMISLIMSLVLIRLVREQGMAQASARLVEHFVDDMEAQLREFGVGDVVIGKRVGKLIGAVDGRMQALASALTSGDMDLRSMLERNLAGFREAADGEQAYTMDRIKALHASLDQADSNMILSGEAIGLS